MPVASDASVTLAGWTRRPQTALGQIDEGVSTLERSASITTRSPKSDLAIARFALARALTAARRDPSRARELATSAQRELRATAGMDREAREIDKWLQSAERPR